LKLSAFFFFISITIAIALLGAPNMMFFGRISAPSEMFIVLSCMCLFPVNLFEMENLSRTNHFVRIGLGILATAFIILLSVDYKNTLSIYMNVSQQSQTRATIIKEAIANEVEVVELPPLYFHAQQSVQNYLKALKAQNQLKALKAHKDHLLAKVQKAAKAGNQEDVDQIEEKIRNIVDPRIRKEQKKVAHWNKKALNTANGDVNTGRLFARDITGDPAKWQNTCFSSANHISRVKLKR
jgi:HEPN domain-containing protein